MSVNRLKKFKEEYEIDYQSLKTFNPEMLSIWYGNRYGVKKQGVDISSIITEERVAELAKCSSDWEYFIENYLFIQTRQKDEWGNRYRPFKLRKYQKEQIELYEKNRFVLLLYPRRSGKTSGTIAYFLWKLLFEENYIILCLANKDKVAMKIIAECRKFIKLLPLWMVEGVVKSNEHEVLFENGSHIFSGATTADSGRSDGANIVYCDEMAFIDNNIFGEFYDAVYPVIEDSPESKFLGTSTPNGMNHFYTMCSEASEVDENGKITKEGTSNFILKKIRWFEVPGRDEAFRLRVIANKGLEHFNSEFDCEFLGSAGTLLPTEVLKRFAKQNPVKIEMFFDKYEFKIYKEPIEKHRYIVTHDPSSGHGGQKDDNTAIIVWDTSDIFNIEQVATLYTSELDELDAPFVLWKICKMYNKALEISERNKCESIPNKLFKELDYENVFRDESGLLGVYQTESLRNTSIATMRRYFKEGKITICNPETILEFSSFIKKGNKYQADTGKHDDLVMSTSLLCFLLSDEKTFERYFTEIGFYKYTNRQDVYNDIILDDSETTTRMKEDLDLDFNFEDEIPFEEDEENKDSDDDEDWF